MFIKKSQKSLNTTKVLALCLMGTGLFGLSACDMAKNQLHTDREANLEAQDYRDMMAPRDTEMADDDQGTIPSLQPYIAEMPENTKPMPLVSISINQTVPLRDALFELAEQADYDIELDPNIRGSVIFTARNRPFDQVIDRISEIGGLRYEFNDDTLRVERDLPYNKTYKVDYLSYIRTTQGLVRTDIGVNSGGTEESGSSGSAFEATSSSEADFWGELEVNLNQILGQGTVRALSTRNDPRISVQEQNPNVAPVAPAQGADGVTVQPPEAVLRVDSLPVMEEEEQSSGNDNGTSLYTPSFAINRQAGLISVYATQRAHKEVDDYLKKLKKSVSAQVLIEAKILEVSLTDSFASGIDWNVVNPIGGDSTLRFLTGTGASSVSPVTVPGSNSNFLLGYASSDITALVNALSQFGTVRALASPRLTVLNNQAAVLNVATNRVFFDIEIDVTQGTDSTPPQTTVDSEIMNVPEGVLVNVQPSINTDTNTIALAVRPTITRIVGEIEDPAVQFIAQSNNANISSVVPEVNVQEIDSLINVRSGQPIVMGGLLQDRIESTQEGVPVLGEIPMFGALFKDKGDSIQKTELVILLKATIVPNGDGTIHDTDKDFYRAFSGDRRPFKL